jgi:RHS repeat-associated protein
VVPSYFHADGLGSVVMATNASGSVTLARQYDAWGMLDTGASEPGYAFTGREWDPEAGLYYYRARYYEPASGRFISGDPIGFGGGLNFYAYAGGNPVVTGDPTGLCPPAPCARFHREAYVSCINAHILPAKGEPSFVAGVVICFAVGAALTPAAGVVCVVVVDVILIKMCTECATYCDKDGPKSECTMYGGGTRPPAPFQVPPPQPYQGPPVR